MTAPAPGWYPDPTGTQGLLRYWDGTQWTEHTTPIPTEAAPSQHSGQQFSPEATNVAQRHSQYAAYPVSGAQPATGSAASGNGKKLGLVIGAAVLALALLGTGGFFGVRALIGHDHSSSASSSDSTNESSPEPSDDPTPSDAPSATAQPTTAGTPLTPKSSQSCYGGMPMRNALPTHPKKLRTPGLSAPHPTGWSEKRSMNRYYSYLDAVALAYRFEEQDWVSTMVIATVPKAITTQSQDPQRMAEEILACTATATYLYRQASGVRTATDVRLPSNLQGAVVSGVVTDNSRGRPRRDQVTVAVVRVGPDKYATIIAAIPPNNPSAAALVQRTVQGLTSP